MKSLDEIKEIIDIHKDELRKDYGLKVIGEAVNKLPHNIRDHYSESPWEEMVGMRNRLTHEYFGVDLNIVWQTIE